MSEDIGRNPTPEELERILRPGLPPTGPVEHFGTWSDDGDKDRATILREYLDRKGSALPVPDDYVAPDGAALFNVPIPDHPEVQEIVGRFVDEMDWQTHWRNYADRVNKMALQVIFDRAMDIRFDTSARPIEEIRARAATSRYWARRLRWLRKRGRA